MHQGLLRVNKRGFSFDDKALGYLKGEAEKKKTKRTK